MKSGILSTIGQTPLIQLKNLYPELSIKLYAKVEMLNPGGSIKDRPAFMMLSKALDKGKVNKSTTIIESSSGNMAIGLAQTCRYLNLNLIVVVDPKINHHTLQILKAYGVTIETVTNADLQGNYLNARLNRVQQLLDSIPNSYWPNQYANKDNPAAHYHTMEEIVQDLPHPPDYLLAATSTCGTIMGCANYVQQHKLNTKIVAVDAVGSVIFDSPSVNRLVPGHGAGRPSELLEKKAIDHVLHITDEECITGCQRLLQREAILAGGSSGAVVMAIEKIESSIPNGSTFVVLLPDSGERYLDTIFNDEWVTEHFDTSVALHLTNGKKEYTKSKPNNKKSPGKNEINTNDGQPSKIIKVAIIGGGPKGMYGFERLAAELKAHPPNQPIEIHVYNKSTDFGAGDIYRPGQLPCLLINNPVGDINMWMDEMPRPVVSKPLSLTEWLQQNHKIDVDPNDYTSRGIVGNYLIHGFKKIAANLPKNVTGQYLIGEVVDIFDDQGKYGLTLKMANDYTQDLHHRYNYLLLATGHPRNKLTLENKKIQQFAGKRKNIEFIPFIYPVESMLKNIPAGSTVAVKGIGLTFVDAILAMTEGRGGSFKRQSTNGKLVYQSSGDEPKTIYPFSRSGLPMIPRGPAPSDAPPLIFLTDTALSELQDAHHDQKLDFETDILPLLKQEMTAAFYNIKLKQAGFKEDLLSCSNFAEVKHYITTFHQENPEAELFNTDDFLHPTKRRSFSTGSAFHAFIQSYWHFYMEEAKKGELKSPWAAVTAVWRKATPLFGKYYAFGGLTPESQYYFDTKFRRKLNRVTFGPPIESVEKMLALIEAGILNFKQARNPDIHMDPASSSFKLEINNFETIEDIHYLVDARIPKVYLPEDRSHLYSNLLKRGLVRMYKNKSEHHTYQPGCMEISRRGFIVDQNGIVNRQIAVTGTPTEGITFDNDALSRSRNNFVSSWAHHIRKSFTQSMIETDGS